MDTRSEPIAPRPPAGAGGRRAGAVLRSAVRHLATALDLARLRLGHVLFGIDFVVRELSRLPRERLPLLLRRHGARIGTETRFKDGLQIDNASGDADSTGDFSNLVIGDRCYVGKGVLFDLPDRIILENQVVVSAGVRLLTHADCGDRIMSRWYPRRRGAIRVGEGSWIGAGATLLCGVELGRCSVVAAGAVVTRSFPERSLVAGVPAVLVRQLPPG